MALNNSAPVSPFVESIYQMQRKTIGKLPFPTKKSSNMHTRYNGS
ncbi:predicted protein [Botrytis cinerea T4]|uniref:Uncharacterized protein n=1 Tax=Botryotinia fuckeliana (strain T4) TaxID=999810 RepID=G2Y8N4_BOTF4|nr:predicted protein [Botrytis cinerea T4]